MIRLLIAGGAIALLCVGSYVHGVDVERARQGAARGAQLAAAVDAETAELETAKAEAQAARNAWAAALIAERTRRVEAARTSAESERTMTAEIAELRRQLDANPAPDTCRLTGDRLRIVRDAYAAACAHAGC